MSFPPGRYFIRSAIDTGLDVGIRVFPPEPIPNAVVTMPRGVEPQEWRLLAVDAVDGLNLYALEVLKQFTSIIDGKVFAASLPDIPPQQWNIERLPQHGDNQYLIKRFKPDEPELAWVLPREEPFTQVEIRPLTPTKSIPPQYPATQRWIIEGPFENK